MDLLEAVLDDTSSPAPGKQMSEEEEAATITSVNVELRESLSHHVDDGTRRRGESGETGDEIASRPSDALKQEGGEVKRQLVVVKTQVLEGVIHKSVDAKSGAGVGGWDEPDGLQSEDLPSPSEDVPSTQKPEPKKKPSFLRRSKKKSHQGNLTNFNKDHVWDFSLLVCAGGKLFWFLFPFCILFTGYFSVCT